MRKMWKKLIAYGVMGAMLVSSLPANAVKVNAASVSSSDIVIADAPAPFRDLTSDELIAEMGTGWNLGNTMDGHSNYAVGETAWQGNVTTKELIKAVHDMGFNTVRLPVTWGNMINEDYSIDESWIGRVEDIIDYCIAENMYVVMNIHHDGADNGEGNAHGWLCLDGDEEEYAKVVEKFEGVWNTIATRFRNYDEHLMFESMNEVFKTGIGWSDNEEEVNSGSLVRINDLNQRFVNVVRATGGNNDKRWLSVPTVNTQIKTLIEDRFTYVLPEDEAGHLMVAAHIYDAITNKGYNYDYQFGKLKELYVDQGVPVFIGEWGFTKNSQRVYQNELVAFMLKKHSIVGCVWDNNGWSETSNQDAYKMVDRTDCIPWQKDVMDGLMRGFYYDTDSTKITTKAPEIVSLTGFDLSAESVELTAGESTTIEVSNRAPEDSNDVVLWKSDNGRVASVSNGKIIARAIGETTITAFSQSGSVEKKITVKVNPQELEVASTGIAVDKDAYQVEKNAEVFLNATVTPADNGAYITYESSNPAVASVSTVGKVLALDLGETTITATTSDGLTKKINVQVVDPAAPEDAKIRLAINILYNDSQNQYFGTETGSDVVTAEQDGTYTLKFDCSTDLSDKAKAANISNLNGLGALYIKDYDVTKGLERKSPDIDLKISYTSIKVNGTELLAAETAQQDAIKSGIFDTGNPLNAWDGSVITDGIQVDVYEVSNKSISFNTVENPTVFEVSFKLTGFPVTSTPSPVPTETAPVASSPAIQGTTTPPAIQPTEAAPTVVDVKKAGVNYNVKEDGTATVKNVAKKNATSITIPSTVKANGETYKVTEIAKNAFKNNKKLKSVVIGKNVTKIGANAFNGCKSLKKITVKSAKLKSVGKNAIKGINKKAVIKVPKAKKKAYKKLFKASTGYKKTMKIK